MKEDNGGKRLFDELLFDVRPAWDQLTPEQLRQVFSFAEGYKAFLTQANCTLVTNYTLATGGVVLP